MVRTFVVPLYWPYLDGRRWSVGLGDVRHPCRSPWKWCLLRSHGQKFLGLDCEWLPKIIPMYDYRTGRFKGHHCNWCNVIKSEPVREYSHGCCSDDDSGRDVDDDDGGIPPLGKFQGVYFVHRCCCCCLEKPSSSWLPPAFLELAILYCQSPRKLIQLLVSNLPVCQPHAGAGGVPRIGIACGITSPYRDYFERVFAYVDASQYLTSMESCPSCIIFVVNDFSESRYLPAWLCRAPPTNRNYCYFGNVHFQGSG
jgi:hypothetical protein